jgi:signal transduction histidine kinase
MIARGLVASFVYVEPFSTRATKEPHMNQSQNNGHLTADVYSTTETLRDGQDTRVRAERAAYSQLQQWNRLLERKLAERTQELDHSLVDLRSLATALDTAEQRERTHLATELHDYLAQLLVLGRMKIGLLQRLPLPSAGDEMVHEVDDVLSQALQYCQTLMAELSPPILHEQGLVAGIRALATQMKRHDLEVRVDLDQIDECAIPPSSAVLLFRSVRELLINTAKHAVVKQATVRLTCDQGLLQIVVRDESGFDLAASQGPQPAGMGSVLSSRIGLLTIRERMKVLNGRVDFESAPKQRTTPTLTLPLGPRTTSIFSA